MVHCVHDTLELIYGVPRKADRALMNAHEVRGRILVLDRGKVLLCSLILSNQLYCLNETLR